MHQQFKVLDSDIHIIEPADLWQRYIDVEFRERAPYGLTATAGDLRLAFDGKPWGRVAGDVDASRRRKGHDQAESAAQSMIADAADERESRAQDRTARDGAQQPAIAARRQH